MKTIYQKLSVLLLLLAGLPLASIAQTDKFEMVVEKTDGTELTFAISTDYPVLQYQYGGENGVNTIAIEMAAGTTDVKCSEIKRLFTRKAKETVEITPITETEEKSFGETINGSTELENIVIDNTYYNIDAANGDGYDATEQAIVLNSTTTSEQMNAVQAAEVGDAAVKDNFNGIIFEIPAGSGTITVDAKTIGTHVLNVQIGNGAPTKVTKTERGTVDVPYDVAVPTYVYLYASTDSGSGARLYRAPSAGANSVLLYGYKVTIGGTGIRLIENGEQIVGDYYDLNGRKVTVPGKGVYIINGKKIVVK